MEGEAKTEAVDHGFAKPAQLCDPVKNSTIWHEQSQRWGVEKSKEPARKILPSQFPKVIEIF